MPEGKYCWRVADQLPTHTHALPASTTAAITPFPQGNVLASAAEMYMNQPAATAVKPLSAASVSTAGLSQPHSNMMLSLSINFIICLQGMYPSQS